MKQKSDKKKLQEGRCLGEGSEYIGFIKANEAKSTGTATEIYDPIENRTVDVLSMGEQEYFWIMRYRDDVQTIREQMRLDKDIVKEVCQQRGFKSPTKILSTDFRISFANGRELACSVKASRKEFDSGRVQKEKYEKLLIRQTIEQEYWKKFGIEFRIVFRDELNHVLAKNIGTCMRFYKPEMVTGIEDQLKYLLAHKVLSIPMDREILRFSKLVNGKENEIAELYRRYRYGIE